jgi:hypothetical protein
VLVISTISIQWFVSEHVVNLKPTTQTWGSINVGIILPSELLGKDLKRGGLA